MKMSSKVADFLLILTAVIWGTGFIATEYALMSGAKPSLIIAMRFIVSGIISFIFFYKDVFKMDKQTFKVGTIAGVVLFAGFYLQTFGQSHTTVSNSSFLTGTNVVMIPFLVWLVTKKPPKTKFFVLAFTTLIGIAILTIDFTNTNLTFNYGDAITLMSAVMFAIHISYLGIYANGLNTRALTFLQMSVAGLCGTIYMFVTEPSAFNMAHITGSFLPVAYLGAFSGCLCYFLQTTAQQHTSPSKAGLFLSMEGFFGCVFSVILGIDPLTASLVIGGAIILTSVIMSEVDIEFKKKSK